MNIIGFARNLIKNFFDNQFKKIEGNIKGKPKLDYEKLERMAKDKTPKNQRVGNYYKQVKSKSRAGVEYMNLKAA